MLAETIDARTTVPSIAPAAPPAPEKPQTVLRGTMRCADGAFHDVLAMKAASADHPYDFYGMYFNPSDPNAQPEPVIGALRSAEGQPILAMAARREGRWCAVGAGRRATDASLATTDFSLAFDIEGQTFVARLHPGTPEKALAHFEFEGRPAPRRTAARKTW